MANVWNPSLPEPLHAALTVIQGQAGPRQLSWLVGGSTGLMLQGVPLAAPPRDLDLYIDREQAAVMHEALKAYAVDEQTESETPIYRSILSHYDIGGVKVELVGAFEVRALESEYKVEAAYLSETLARHLVLPDLGDIRLMPLMHELIFNVLRARPDRYHAIADVCRLQDAELHKHALQRLAARNRFSVTLTHTLECLLEDEDCGSRI